MRRNNYRKRHRALAIERYETAPVANMKNVQDMSNVSIPSITSVELAKEYVDTNEK